MELKVCYNHSFEGVVLGNEFCCFCGNYFLTLVEMLLSQLLKHYIFLQIFKRINFFETMHVFTITNYFLSIDVVLL